MLCHTLGIAIHGAVAYNDAFLGLILRHAVIHANNLIDVLMPYWSVGGTDIVELHTCQFLQGILYRHTILTDDIGIVAYHLKPEGVTIDLFVYDTTIESAETTEGIARE